MTRDSSTPAAAPDRSRNRVLRWLNDPGARSQGAAVDASPALQATEPFGPPLTARAALTARQRVGQLWKRWKSKALGTKPDASSLSTAVLKHHQQLCELHRVSSIGFAADAGLPWAAGQHGSPQDASGSAAQAPVTPAAGQQTSRVAAAYNSPFYQPSCSNQPPEPSPVIHLEVTASGGTSMHRSPAAINSPLPSSTSCSSAVTATGETSSPSVTPRGVSVLRRSTAESSFNHTHCSDPSHHGALVAAMGSRDWGAPVLQQQMLPQQLGGGDAATGDGEAADHTAAPASPALPPRPPQFGQRSPMQHSPDMWTTGNAQLQQLLQGPTQQFPVQQMRPAVINSSSGPMLPAGTALTAYPAVAAALNNTAATGWLQRSAASTHASLLQHGSFSTTAPYHGQEGTAVVPALYKQGSSTALPPPGTLCLESPFARAAGHCAAAALQAPVQPAVPTEGAAAVAEASTTQEDVQGWLLRAAVLEDELQGRAMEIAEELQVLQERREVLASLTQALQQSPAGSAEHEAAVQSAVSRLGAGRSSMGRSSSGSLYRAGRVAETGRPRTPGIRSQVHAELNRVDNHLSQMQGRAVDLGSALATLQGCQAVLGSSKGATLRPCSRLAVLQLVLSDVVARLPAERLQELPVLEGLPSLDTEAREICRLAEASSIQASVQPLLHAGAYPPPAQHQQQPRFDAAAPPTAHSAASHASGALHGGLHRQGSGFSRSSDATGTSYSRPSVVAPTQPGSAQQQQQPWYADLKPEGEGDDDDDDILDSLSSVLSSKQYTPRLSLSYESRKAAAAAEARRTAAVLAQRPASAIAPSGSAAAAGAAALTLAGIASSGSWSQWPPEDTGSELGVGSSKHAGMWDMLCVHSSSAAPSQHKWQPLPYQLLPQPSSPSSVSSSRRGIGKAGLPYPLPSWPESPTATTVAATGPQDSPQGPPTPQTAATVLRLMSGSGSGSNSAQHHRLTALYGQLQQASGSWTVPDSDPQPVVHAESTCVPHSMGLHHGMQPAALAVASGEEEAQGGSRSSSFESCVSARSRFSMEVSSALTPAGPSTPARAPAGQGSSSAFGGQLPTVVQAGSKTGGQTGAAAAAASSSVMNAPVAAALPAGADLNSMTVGELLSALSSAVSQHSHV